MKLTIYSKKVEFEKLALKAMLSQTDKFGFKDVFQVVKSNCDESVPIEFLIEITDNAFEFCLSDEFIQIYAAMLYTINPSKRTLFENFVNGITNIEHSI